MKFRTALLIVPFFLSACAAQSQVQIKNSVRAVSSATSSAKTSTGSIASTLPQSYTSPRDHFSIRYPTGWTVQEHVLSPLTTHISYGTAFVPPSNYAKGTTFLNAMVFVETNRTPCVQFVNPIEMAMNGRTYMKGNFTNVGTRNYQRYLLYTVPTKDTCYGMTLYTHGCNLNDKCGTETNRVNTFDSKDLNHTFEQMVQSLKPL